jgi:hypothetical protein
MQGVLLYNFFACDFAGKRRFSVQYFENANLRSNKTYDRKNFLSYSLHSYIRLVEECIARNQSSAINCLPQSQNNKVDYLLFENYFGNPV